MAKPSMALSFNNHFKNITINLNNYTIFNNNNLKTTSESETRFSCFSPRTKSQIFPVSFVVGKVKRSLPTSLSFPRNSDLSPIPILFGY
jgi:hypothetical protein